MRSLRSRKRWNPSIAAINVDSKNAVLNVPEIEAKVKEATNNEAWGPSGTQLHEIAMATSDEYALFGFCFAFYLCLVGLSYLFRQSKSLVVQAIFKRFLEVGPNWRKCYKALLLLDYVLKNGTRRFVDDVRDHMHQLKNLSDFQYIDPETGRDQGINGSLVSLFILRRVREKSKLIVDLLNNNDRLQDEREKAKRSRERFHGGDKGGISSTDYGSRSRDDDGTCLRSFCDLSDYKPSSYRDRDEDRYEPKRSDPMPSREEPSSSRPRVSFDDDRVTATASRVAAMDIKSQCPLSSLLQ